MASENQVSLALVAGAGEELSAISIMIIVPTSCHRNKAPPNYSDIDGKA